MPMKNVWAAIAAMIFPNIGAIALNLLITRHNLEPWSNSLTKPWWRAPPSAHASVAIGLYLLMGYASYRVWCEGGGFKGAALPLSIYVANVLLNWAWTPIYFGAHNISLAFYEALILWITIAVTGVTFYRVDRKAGCIIIPYLMWITYTTALNYQIYLLNPAIGEKNN